LRTLGFEKGVRVHEGNPLKGRPSVIEIFRALTNQQRWQIALRRYSTLFRTAPRAGHYCTLNGSVKSRVPTGRRLRSGKNRRGVEVGRKTPPDRRGRLTGQPYGDDAEKAQSVPMWYLILGNRGRQESAIQRKGRFCLGFSWWAGAESNCRHEDFQSSALPTELPAHRIRRRKPLRSLIATDPQRSLQSPFAAPLTP
jgi:hypothetical protein